MQLALYEQTELDQYEATIEHGIKTFIEVGNALMSIREKKLYREFGTFEEYCQKRWGWTRQHANRLIASASVIKNLEPIGSITPSNIEQTRPLAALAPEQQREAWQEAVETAPNGKITGAHVETVVERYKQPDEPEAEPAVVTPQPTVNRSYKNSSESNEWYTPRWLIEKALAIMGGIDLDPASSPTANQNVLASKIYTIDDDALTQPWFGRVWLNPPYGNDVEPFVDKLLASVESAEVNEAVLLVAARTDTAWFRKLREFPRCFIWGRLKFINGATGEAGDPAGFPSMAVYMGPNFLTFADEFKSIGDIYIWWKE